MEVIHKHTPAKMCVVFALTYFYLLQPILQHEALQTQIFARPVL